MHISDKNFGYLVIASLLAGSLILLYIIFDKHRHTKHTFEIVFEDVGTLQPDDPVVMKGLPIGRVVSIRQEAKSAKVIIEFHEPQYLFESTQYINENYSLMGARWLRIHHPDRSKILADTIQQASGIFEPGIAEAMHKIEEMVGQVSRIKEIATAYALGTDSQKSIIAMFNQSLEGTTEALRRLTFGLQENTPGVLEIASEGYFATTQALKLTDSTRQYLSNVLAASNQSTHQLQNQILQYLSQIQQMLALLDQLKGTEIYTALMQNSEIMESMAKNIQSLEAIVKIIGLDGLFVEDEKGRRKGITSFRRLNLWGATARQKNAREAKQQKKE
jgi:ABC-type transporter Mla subunit MlaD